MKTPKFILVFTTAKGECFGQPFDGWPTREIIGMYYSDYHGCPAKTEKQFVNWYERAVSDGCRASLYELVIR